MCLRWNVHDPNVSNDDVCCWIPVINNFSAGIESIAIIINIDLGELNVAVCRQFYIAAIKTCHLLFRFHFLNGQAACGHIDNLAVLDLCNSSLFSNLANLVLPVLL